MRDGPGWRAEVDLPPSRCPTALTRSSSTLRAPTTPPPSPSSSCSPNGGATARAEYTTRDAGEPGVRLRCYVDLRQPVGSDASAHVPSQVFTDVQRWRSPVTWCGPRPVVAVRRVPRTVPGRSRGAGTRSGGRRGPARR
ncbi:DUF6207 family protein [Streptomyces nigra]|uniref:DUF6207 family protein n=1 Tax=Streptomyces nigra TaxID=1827580 RepID=UPI0035D9B39D